MLSLQGHVALSESGVVFKHVKFFFISEEPGICERRKHRVCESEKCHCSKQKSSGSQTERITAGITKIRSGNMKHRTLVLAGVGLMFFTVK